MSSYDAATEAFLAAESNQGSQPESNQSTNEGKGVDSINSIESLSNLFGAENTEELSSTEKTEEELLQEALVDSEEISPDTEEDSEDNDSEEDEGEPVFSIKVEGKDIEVKQSELIADAQKWRAANTKFDEASALRKEADEIKTTYAKEREILQSVLSQYQQFVENSYKEQQPDWNYLYQNDTLEYFKQKEVWSAKLAQVEQAKAYQATLQKQQAKEQEIAAEKMISEQRKKVFDIFPEWKNKDVAAKAVTQIDKFLEESGFNATERQSLNDARLLAVAHKAALYDKLVKSVPAKNASSKKNANAGKSINGNANTSLPTTESRNAKREQSVRQKFNKNPTVDNLAEFFK